MPEHNFFEISLFSLLNLDGTTIIHLFLRLKAQEEKSDMGGVIYSSKFEGRIKWSRAGKVKGQLESHSSHPEKRCQGPALGL